MNKQTQIGEILEPFVEAREIAKRMATSVKGENRSVILLMHLIDSAIRRATAKLRASGINSILLFLLMLIPALANAERPTLNIYYVVASNALPPEHLDDLVGKIKASFKEEFNVGIRTRVRYVKNNYIPYNLGTRLTQFNHWYSKYAAKQKRKWSLVITPPYYDNGQQYLAGLGHDLCFAKNEWGVRSIMAMMTAELYNDKGQDRYPHSLKGIMHELGHNLGFDHNPSENPFSIMHPNVLFYVNDHDLHFNAKERKVGRKCLLAVRKGNA